MITWTNERRKLGDLIPWEQNPRGISDAEAERLGDSLVEFGQIQTIAIGPGDEILDGHQRKAVWSLLPQFGPGLKVDVRVASRTLTDKERQKLVVFLHRGTMGDWDWDELASSFEVPELLEWGFEESELQFDLGNDAIPDLGAQVDRAAELQEKWQVQRGQVWEIPSKSVKGKAHRVMCGDSTSAEDVEWLTAGTLVPLVIIDPPYGVEYADKNKFLNAIARGNRIQEQIKGDHGTKEQTQQLWRSAFCETEKVMSAGAVIYCFMPQGGDQMMMMMMMDGAGIEPRHELIWLKNNHVLGRVDYAYKHEPILYAWKAGGHKFYGDFQTSILEFPKPHQSDLHPTTKPVELIARLIVNSSLLRELVYDAFVGSGTTLVACEQTARVGYGMEIEPKYVSATLERLTGMGLEPILWKLIGQ
jgi:DNA modification methylase